MFEMRIAVNCILYTFPISFCNSSTTTMRKISTLLALLIICAGSHAQNFNMQFRSEIVYPYSCASIWAYVKDDHEYALVGTYEGVSVVDVTDPDAPVNLFDVVHQGAESEWREIKTYDHYAYATNETGKGILIMDLQYLPDSIPQYQFIYNPPSGSNQTTGHTLWIDENGRLFVFGGNYAQGYACFDLTSDPLNPPYLGKYSSKYIHDGFVRGDTLWASEIFNGKLEVLDVSNPASPVSLASFSTPNNFTHNSWPTHDNRYLFTTDEVNNSYLTSYDVSDLDNITELDKAQSNPGSQVIIHNVHLLNDQYAYTAYYKDGVVLFDVSHPDNIIEVASYDTDPGESGGDYGGTWGVYPYLPSGNIISSDLYDGCEGTGKLTVLTPTYVSACWLEGTISDSIAGNPLNNVQVKVIGTSNSDFSNLSGVYKTGNGIPGTYDIQFSKAGYASKTVSLSLNSGAVTSFNVQLVPVTSFAFSGQVLDANTGNPVAGVNVLFDGDINGDFSAVTDASGNFSLSSIYSGSYNVYAGKWGYVTKQLPNASLNENTSPITFQLDRGYYDDFVFDFLWVSSGGNSNSGKWIRDEPIGTYGCDGLYNPEYDVTSDYGDQCYMTGNGGGSAGTSDVDNTVVNLTSPVFDLSTYTDPGISFYLWWVDAVITNAADDTLHVKLSNGNTTVPLLDLYAGDSDDEWKPYSFKVSDYITPTSNMTLKLSTVDYDQVNSNWIEAAIDQFEVNDSVATVTSGINPDHSIVAFPNPFNRETTIYWKNEAGDCRIGVTDLSGRILEDYTAVASGHLTVGRSLPAGLYLVTFISDGKVIHQKKLVKQ